MTFNLVGQMFVRLRHLAEQGHLREIRAELIVQIARDAGPFLFERLLLLQLRELPLEFLRGDKMHHADHRRRAAPSPTRVMNHHSCQNGGRTRIETVAGFGFQTPSSLHAVTWKR